MELTFAELKIWKVVLSCMLKGEHIRSLITLLLFPFQIMMIVRDNRALRGEYKFLYMHLKSYRVNRFGDIGESGDLKNVKNYQSLRLISKRPSTRPRWLWKKDEERPREY